LFSFGLLLLLWCFSTLGNDYFDILFSKKIILSDEKNGCKYHDIFPLTRRSTYCKEEQEQEQEEREKGAT